VRAAGATAWLQRSGRTMQIAPSNPLLQPTRSAAVAGAVDPRPRSCASSRGAPAPAAQVPESSRAAGCWSSCWSAPPRRCPCSGLRCGGQFLGCTLASTPLLCATACRGRGCACGRRGYRGGLGGVHVASAGVHIGLGGRPTSTTGQHANENATVVACLTGRRPVAPHKSTHLNPTLPRSPLGP
jgi:hypothetical protein